MKERSDPVTNNKNKETEKKMELKSNTTPKTTKQGKPLGFYFL